jgi:hypothetical protein
MKEVAGIVIAYWFGFLPFISLAAGRHTSFFSHSTRNFVCHLFQGVFEVPIPGEVFK